MESHPRSDLGTPGALVHFVEQMPDRPYERLLLASLARRPTAHTVWMLQRLINGTKERKRHKRLLLALRAAAAHPKADRETKEHVKLFVEGG